MIDDRPPLEDAIENAAKPVPAGTDIESDGPPADPTGAADEIYLDALPALGGEALDFLAATGC